MTTAAEHRAMAELEAGLEEVRRSPKDEGPLQLIVRRPERGERVLVDEGSLDTGVGLVGDNWATRGSTGTPDGSADPELQVTLMNSRAADLMTGSRERWHIAGDQLFVDLDISRENLPPGTRLFIGTAVLEVSVKPHTGCAKFSGRFGTDALRLVSSAVGQELCLRGINAKVVQSGAIRLGDAVRKLAAE
ncbi:MAG: MOSC domain-containing protein [Chloroflexi bacterium]|nr:MOSC domain-containing protein [Chloroflexota bacterium]